MLWRLITHSGPVPPGLIDCAIFNCPATEGFDTAAKKQADKQLAAKFCRMNNLVSKFPPELKLPTKYMLELIYDNQDNSCIILCVSRSIPVVDHAGVQAGLTAPVGQRGQNRQHGQVQQGGFQELADDALPAGADDSVYGGGDLTDSAYMDLVQTGGDLRETPRPQLAGYSAYPG